MKPRKPSNVKQLYWMVQNSCWQKQEWKVVEMGRQGSLSKNGFWREQIDREIDRKSDTQEIRLIDLKTDKVKVKQTGDQTKKQYNRRKKVRQRDRKWGISESLYDPWHCIHVLVGSRADLLSGFYTLKTALYSCITVLRIIPLSSHRGERGQRGRVPQDGWSGIGSQSL